MRVILTALIFATPLAAAVIPTAPATLVLDGSIDEWKPLRPFARSDTGDAIWFARSRSGLVIAGRTTATHPVVAIRLALADTPELPEIDCNPDDKLKSACVAWIARQEAYRKLLLKQFERGWQIAPDGAAEVSALPAWKTMTPEQQQALDLPSPDELPRRKFQTGANGTVTFEILIPWQIFPPADELSLSSLRLSAAINSNDIARLSTSEGDELPKVPLSRPIVTRISPCAQQLDEQGFYFLTPSFEVTRVFTFQNEEMPEVSPIAHYRNFFSQALGPGEKLCGPQLSYRNGSITKQYPIQLGPGNGEEFENVTAEFPVKRLPDGTRLIRDGPREYTLPLSRKAHIYYSFRIYALTPGLNILEALTRTASSENDDGYAIEISDDWLTVTEYRFRPATDSWNSLKFCLTGRTYRSCGENSKSPPPKHPLLDPNQ
jgi:hypothetical protein